MGRLYRPELPPGALADLVRELHALHARAGRPNTRRLAEERDFGYTAVHDLFTKTTTEPPKLPVLLTVVERLAMLAPRMNVEQTLDRFDALWRAADAEPLQKPSTAAELYVETSSGELKKNGVAEREPVQLTVWEKAVLGRMAQHKLREQIRWELEGLSRQHYSMIEHKLYFKLGAMEAGRPQLLSRARELGLLKPEGNTEESPGIPHIYGATSMDSNQYYPFPHPAEVDRSDISGFEWIRRLKRSSALRAVYARIDSNGRGRALVDPLTNAPALLIDDDTVVTAIPQRLPATSPLAEVILDRLIWIRTAVKSQGVVFRGSRVIFV